MEGPTPVELGVSYLGSEAVVSLGGEIDVLSAKRVRAIVQAALAMGSASVTFDCSRLTYIDSSGLAVFSFAAQETRRRNGTVAVASPTEVLARMLRTTGLDDVVEVR